MNPFDIAKTMGEAWARGSQSFVDSQRDLFKAMTQAMPQAVPKPTLPDVEAFQSALGSFKQALENAQSVSETFAKTLGPKGTKPDPIAQEIMAKVFDPRGWLAATNEVDEALNRMAEGPRLADLWNVERKFAELTTSWLALRRRNLEHNTVMLEAWSKAASRFSKAVEEQATKGEAAESARALMNQWVEVANDTLLETQRTEAFLKSQRDTLKASTDLRLAQQEVGEFYAQMFGYPTRAELDDVHKTVTELRREVRALTREGRARKTQPRPEIPETAEPAARKPAARKGGRAA